MDLFAGAGGIAEGFRQAGFTVVVGNDSDPDACATFQLNFPDATVVHGDIRQQSVKSRILEAARGADLVVGGPPCQAFSQVRNHVRIIDDPRNSLYKEFVHIVGEVMPAAFLMENVTGIDQMGFREQIASDLALGGRYEVLPQVIDAADVGVPQTRKRLIFIGVRKGRGVVPPTVRQTHATSLLSLLRTERRGKVRYEAQELDDLLGSAAAAALRDTNDLSIVSAAQALSDLEVLPSGLRHDSLLYASLPEPQTAYQRYARAGAGELLFNVQVPRMRKDTQLRLRAVPPGGNHRDLPERLLVRNITGEKWGQENGTGKLSRRHYYAYRRLHPDMWSWTLNTKADCVYHYGVLRSLSVREFARLHSFPDRFVFTTDPRTGPLPGRHDGGPAHSRYRQVGNAVPPLLARACAEAIRETLEIMVNRPELVAA
ncbi:DNA cytosine methyltransferase [Rhizobacter sp. SG703]|uniref:DNA (cytosine-5-)-methyltransferase n=1 Tax=Rhizobacter sp. SG703 TaxID=2587140 RepID=UPI00184D05D5|nr:DNA (cytosine-5)-methyltransferase 1 [Rhizobacter sp. SG703]